MADAVIFEPLPYRSALKDNCTDVIVLRTRADNVSVTVKMGLMEKMIMTRFFGRKQGLPDLVGYMHKQFHKLIYAEDILALNAANQRYIEDDSSPRLFGIALPPGVPEVKRFETSRAVIFENVRLGFATAYDALVEDRSQAGRGYEVAKSIWPDSILDDVPAHLKKIETSDDVMLPPPREVFEEALMESSADALSVPFSKRAALLSALKRFQTMVLGGINNKSS